MHQNIRSDIGIIASLWYRDPAMICDDEISRVKVSVLSNFGWMGFDIRRSPCIAQSCRNRVVSRGTGYSGTGTPLFYYWLWTRVLFLLSSTSCLFGLLPLQNLVKRFVFVYGVTFVGATTVLVGNSELSCLCFLAKGSKKHKLPLPVNGFPFTVLLFGTLCFLVSQKELLRFFPPTLPTFWFLLS